MEFESCIKCYLDLRVSFIKKPNGLQLADIGCAELRLSDDVILDVTELVTKDPLAVVFLEDKISELVKAKAEIMDEQKALKSARYEKSWKE